MRIIEDVPVSLIDYDRLPLNASGLDTANAIADGVEMPPIHLALKPDGRFYVCDGRHRLLGHKLNGLLKIESRYSTRVCLRP